MRYGKLILGLVAGLALAGSAAYAQPLDPDIVPPDVVIPYSMPPGSAPATPTSAHSSPAMTSQTPAPGLTNDQSGMPAAKHRGVLGQVSSPPGTPFNSQISGNAYQNKHMPGQPGMQMQGQPGMQGGVPQGAPPGGQAQNVDLNDCPGCNKHKSLQSTAPMGSGFTNPGQLITGAPQNAVPGMQAPMGDPVVLIQTTKGPITLRLFREHAPRTVANFVDLVQRGFYNGITWHRVEPGFCIQAGCPKGDGSGGFIDPATNQERRVNLELSPRLRHNAAGVVAMARFGNDMNSASSQFYITQSAQPHLDQKYSIFGGVIGGMDTVMRMQRGDKIISMQLQQ